MAAINVCVMAICGQIPLTIDRALAHRILALTSLIFATQPPKTAATPARTSMMGGTPALAEEKAGGRLHQSLNVFPRSTTARWEMHVALTNPRTFPALLLVRINVLIIKMGPIIVFVKHRAGLIHLGTITTLPLPSVAWRLETRA